MKDIVRTYVDPKGVIVNQSIQDGTQISKGLEAEVTANPVSGLNVTAVLLTMILILRMRLQM